MQKLSTFINESKFSLKINKFLASIFYIIAVAVLYFISWTFKYISPEASLIFNMVLSCISLISVALFSHNVKAFYPILMFFMISIPQLPAIGDLHWSLIVSASVLICTLIVFTLKKLFFMGGLRYDISPFNITFAIMCVLVVISYGINANSGEFLQMYVSGGAALIVILVGMLILSIITFITADNTEATFKKDYLFYLFIIIAYYMIVQYSINAIAQVVAGDHFDLFLDSIGWGNRNTFGKLGCICLLFIYFKVIKNPKKYWYLIITYVALLFIIATTNSRGALGFAVALTIVLMIESIVRWKKHYLEITLIYTTVVALVLCLISTVPEFKSLFSRFFEQKLNLNGRDIIWSTIINDTLINASPVRFIFGGSTPYLFALSPSLNVFEGNTFLLCHSTFFTYLALMGILGCLLFVAHSGMQLLTTFRYFKQDERLLVLILVVLGITYGIIDNTTFEFVYSLPLILIFSTGVRDKEAIFVFENKKFQVKR